GFPTYFMWSPDNGHMGIGGVPAGNGVGGQAKISVDGLFVCGTTYNAVEDYHEMSRYDVTAGTWTACGGIGGETDAEISSGWAISGDGQTVGGLGWINAGGAHGMLWNPVDGPIDLGSTVRGQSSRVNALNGDGTVAAGWQDGAGRQGAVWVNGVQELIFKPEGGAALEAFDVSADGQWVTGFGIGTFFTNGQAYRYNTVTDTNENIPNLVVGGAQRMAGSGITDDGATIVGGTWGIGPATFGNAFIWREGIGTTTMGAYLDELGIEYPENFHFAFGAAISSDGQWIAGWGDIGGPAQIRTWIVHLPAAGCVADLTDDGMVGADDLAALLAAWGTNGADLDGDGDTGAADLAILLAAWGACP
ncbi:MAG: hypothetical protein KDA25_05370, partial [Phycisphaerales bacterium]|nr:hypothetical protein [Phycisphaerales bacterium]